VEQDGNDIRGENRLSLQSIIYTFARPAREKTMNCILHLILLLVLFFPASLYAGKADITDVKVTKHSEGTFTFEVTVNHADEGWDHYADSWEIRDQKGNLLATRTLHHPHVSEQPFTRSLSFVKIPAEIKEVTLRAHDSVHLYGGKTITIMIP
jgi:hypothetical protein